MRRQGRRLIGLVVLLIAAGTLVVILQVRTAGRRPDSDGTGATTYYVDATGGSDANSGTSPESAWRTIAKVDGAALLPGDSVLFKRGQTWRGQIYPRASGAPGSPITYGAYGTGAKPLILGSIALGAAPWSQSATGVWRTSISRMQDIGNLIFDGEASCGHKVFDYSAMVSGSQGYFWWDDAGYLYLRSSGDPRRFYSTIEAAVSTTDNVHSGVRIRNQSYITVRDLDFRYQANMGVYVDGETLVRGVTVENCNFAFIGGVNYQSDADPLRAGNGVFAWRNVHDLVVRYNTFFGIYDAAMGTQGLGPGDSATNQYWHHNFVTRAGWGWEWGSMTGGTTDRIVVENNLLYDMDGGWSYTTHQRPDDYLSAGAKFWTNAGTSTNHSFQHNTIRLTGAEHLIVCSNPQNSLTGWTIDYNTYRPDGPTAFTYGWTVYPTPRTYDLTGWKAITGMDLHSSAEPGSVN